jgi:hypothetical protein
MEAAAPAVGLAGDEVGEAEGLTCNRFVAGVWVGAAPEMAYGGDGRRQPLGPLAPASSQPGQGKGRHWLL